MTCDMICDIMCDVEFGCFCVIFCDLKPSRLKIHNNKSHENSISVNSRRREYHTSLFEYAHSSTACGEERPQIWGLMRL